jgi:tripartite-type tricarboxylate transporter receptor subunit TctC
MLKLRRLVWIFSFAAMGFGPGAVYGQEFPSKPIRIITSALGGGSDFASRLVAQGISGPLGQPILVENRSGVIPGEMVSRSPPDGHTLLGTASTLWIGPLLQKSPYDPVTDFAPITLIAKAPNILVVHPSVPAKSVKELVALAKAKSLSGSTGGTGGGSHLSLELFNALAGAKVVRIPYKDSTRELADLISGEVQMTFGAPASLMPQVKAGKLRVLGITSAQPSALLPGLPTIAANGLPGYEMISLSSLFAPAKTPDPIIRRLNNEIARYLQTAEAKDRLTGFGVEPVGSSPEELAATVKSEMARLGKVIKDAGISLN